MWSGCSGGQSSLSIISQDPPLQIDRAALLAPRSDGWERQNIGWHLSQIQIIMRKARETEQSHILKKERFFRGVQRDKGSGLPSLSFPWSPCSPPQSHCFSWPHNLLVMGLVALSFQGFYSYGFDSLQVTQRSPVYNQIPVYFADRVTYLALRYPEVCSYLASESHSHIASPSQRDFTIPCFAWAHGGSC